MSNKIVIGLTGPFGSGCSYIAHSFFEASGYRYLSLSDILREQDSESTRSRTEMQDFGNKLRENYGADILAKKAYEIINNGVEKKWVVDSIRNTHEIEYLKKSIGSFFLLAVWAGQEVRWGRVEGRYDRNRVDFEKDDTRDSRENSENGQQVSLCYQMADMIIANDKSIVNPGTDDYRELERRVQKFIGLVEGTRSFTPSEQETLMSMAYANSMRSSCSQRKVGALIIDEYGNVVSSGYNEVPTFEKPCKNTYGICYRKFLRNQFSDELTGIISDEATKTAVVASVKQHFKGLDYCRALHAEENAIVNLARVGSGNDLNKATLYTTTYPCNLCANKIAQVGIRRIVYFEPYPQNEAKSILQAHHVAQIPFEGVTFNGYFRFMEVLR